MLGLDNSGKTTILYKLKLNETINTIPTIGFNVENIEHKNLNLTIWDIGGQTKLRKLWRHYYQNTNVLIFVIDSNDSDRINEVKQELHCITNEPEMEKLNCVLIYNNKIDLPNSLHHNSLENLLELYKLKKTWHIQPCCAITDEGIPEGFDWISKNII